MARSELISKIEALPGELRRLVAGASPEQLDRPYRPDGWSSRQVIHHLADSHIHAYIRCRFILLENDPPLKPYDQNAWAALPDASCGPIEPSLAILDGLHARWAAFFRSVPDDAWTRKGYHPEYGSLTLERLLETYAAHGEKHLNHIRAGIAQA